ncbi:MAG: BrnT family toxin [Hyphomicrobiales bacterium]
MAHDEEFEWDKAKAADNQARHGVSFEAAQGIFGDPFAIEFEDDRKSYGEQRFVIIGTVDDRVLSVVYTMREETIRIISARGATAYERRKYHEENG